MEKMEYKKLGDVCKIVYGKGLPTKGLKAEGFPVFGANGIIGFNDKYLYEEPEVLISCRGAYSGKINFSPSKCFVTNNSLVLEIKDQELLDKKFLFHILHSVNKSKLVTGTAQPQVTINNAVELEFPLPPKETQQQIVSKIEELFSELDKGIEELKTAQQQLKVYRQAVLQGAFEGKLTNEDVKDGELPDGWKNSTIGDLFEVFVGSTPSRKNTNYWNGTVNWISSGEVAFNNITNTREKISQEGLENSSCKVHPPGTVIMAMIGEGKTRGQAAILKVPAAHNQNTAAIRVPADHKSELLYYFLVLKYEENRKIGSGNNQKALNKERVKSISFPIIPFEEQQQIVQEIESRLSVCDKIEETINDSLKQAEALRQSILKQAFEGRLIEKN